jgi:hypothetical protein
MTNTRDKLNETKHFLEEMRRVSPEPDKFRYELTAFLAASRSITQIMQKEFSDHSSFDEWYAAKQKEIENNPVLKYLHRQRSLTYHKRPVLSYPIRVTDQVVNSTGINVILTGTASTLSLSSSSINFTDIEPDIKIQYYFDDISEKNKDVITLCQEAVNELEKIVDDCEDKLCNDN